ncbi:MAG: hypothetical protein JWM11_6208 [Planctomycetaceae bacterium]|nr:hypothetical protein [Planctomycetaceae bacterium]
MRNFLRVICTVLWVLGGTATCFSSDYSVTFNKTLPNSLIVQIGNSSYHTFVIWGTSYTPVKRNGVLVKEGSLMTNASDYPIVSIHIKNLAGTFDIPADAGGGVFTDVWVSNDKTEAIFNGALIDPGSSLWMKVAPKGPNPDRTLQGMFSDKMIVPDKSKWKRIAALSQDEVWNRLLASLPQKHRTIKLFGKSANGQRFFLLSDEGQFFWYDEKDGQAKRAILKSPVSADVNRIVFENEGDREGVALYENDVRVFVHMP